MWSSLRSLLSTAKIAFERAAAEEHLWADRSEAKKELRKKNVVTGDQIARTLSDENRGATDTSSSIQPGPPFFSYEIAVLTINRFVREHEEDQRIFHVRAGRICNLAFSREEYRNHLLTALKSHDPAKKSKFVEACGTHVFPFLSELATWQLLSTDLSYLLLPKGTQIECNSTSYTLSERIVDRKTSFLSYFLSSWESKRHVILFAGTTARSPCPLVQNAIGPGIVADAEHEGVGQTSFQAHLGTLAKWVQAVPDDGELVITGHSLGGARACRLWLKIDQAQRQRSKLRVFCAPGLDDVSLRASNTGSCDVVAVHHMVDVVARAGEGHVRGRRLCITNPVERLEDIVGVHSRLFLAENELWGQELRYVESSDAVAVSSGFEQIRKSLLPVARWSEAFLLRRWPEPSIAGDAAGPRN